MHRELFKNNRRDVDDGGLARLDVALPVEVAAVPSDVSSELGRAHGRDDAVHVLRVGEVVDQAVLLHGRGNLADVGPVGHHIACRAATVVAVERLARALGHELLLQGEGTPRARFFSRDYEAHVRAIADALGLEIRVCLLQGLEEERQGDHLSSVDHGELEIHI